MPRHMPRNLLEIIAMQCADRVAIVGRNGETLTYGLLREHLDGTGAMLRRAGITRDTRVACVVSDGAEAAVALLAVASAATCVPLHPSCGADEFEVYLAEARVGAVLLDGSASTLQRVAQRRSIPIMEIGPWTGGVPVVTPLWDPDGTVSTGGCPDPEDTAVVFRTSGTTGRPKRVPLTHAMLCMRVCGSAAAFPSPSADGRGPLSQSHAAVLLRRLLHPAGGARGGEQRRVAVEP